MNQDIDQMIPEDIQFAESIVKSKGEIDNIPGYQQSIKRQIVPNISDIQVLLNTWPIIKDKRGLIDVAVNNKTVSAIKTNTAELINT